MRYSLIPAFLLSFGQLVFAQTVPSLINYQGRLTDQAGAPLKDANYGIEFRLWDSVTNNSGLVWGERQNVSVQANGVFNLILGAPGGSVITNPLPAVNDLAFAFSTASRYLGVTIVSSNGVSISTPAEIVPRQQLMSVPFAVMSQQIADGAVNTAKIADGVVTSAKLAQEIADRLVPAGTIIAFGGPQSAIPVGWTLCDGADVSRVGNPRLWAAIGTSYGSGDGSTTFNVSDLRGVFLRGVDFSSARGTTSRDPDASDRVAWKPGGSTGNAVGSFQSDEIKSHVHTTSRRYVNVATGGAGPWSGGGQPGGTGIFDGVNPTGGSESRPKNVYVNYIIKN